MTVGNAGAHAKNFSVLHDTDNPAISLAPLYDVLSTIALELADSAGQPTQADTLLDQRVSGSAGQRVSGSAGQRAGRYQEGDRTTGAARPECRTLRLA